MTHLTGFACPPAALRSAYGTPAPLREARLAGGQANPVKWVIINVPWYKMRPARDQMKGRRTMSWQRYLPYVLIWGAAPAPLYIWLLIWLWLRWTG